MTEKVRGISGGMTEDLGFPAERREDIGLLVKGGGGGGQHAFDLLDVFAECFDALSPTSAHSHGLFVEPL